MDIFSVTQIRNVMWLKITIPNVKHGIYSRIVNKFHYNYKTLHVNSVFSNTV